ncbi:hypothetical protein ABK040_003374 [Willaertia magna]
MFMFHYTSGKRGYNYFNQTKQQPPPKEEEELSNNKEEFKITKQDIIQLLTTEHSIRRSSTIQEAYTNADTDCLQLEKITDLVQQEAIEKTFKIKKEIDLKKFNKILNILRNVRIEYKDDKDVNQLTDYFKYDFSRKGNLLKGDIVKLNDLILFEMIDNQMSTTSLSEKSFNEVIKYCDFIHKLFKQYKSQLFFLTIYIKEAHAVDQWKLGNTICINQHKTIQERELAAIQLKKNLNYEIPIFLDSMNNSFEELFCIWPERFILLEKDCNNNYKIIYLSEPESMNELMIHSPFSLEKAIIDYLNC